MTTRKRYARSRDSLLRRAHNVASTRPFWPGTDAWREWQQMWMLIDYISDALRSPER